MKIETKYNIGDKVAIERDGELLVMTIDEVCATKVAKEPVGISYSGIETVVQRTTIAEDAISCIYSRAEATKTYTLANGVYIITKNKFIIPLAEAERDNTALGVVLISDYARIFIDKREPRDLSWADATECAAEQSFNGEPMRLPDTHEGQEIAFNRDKINKAMELIGGDAIRANWYWTNREFNSTAAYDFYGYDGNMFSSIKCRVYSVRAVSAFSKIVQSLTIPCRPKGEDQSFEIIPVTAYREKGKWYYALFYKKIEKWHICGDWKPIEYK